MATGTWMTDLYEDDDNRSCCCDWTRSSGGKCRMKRVVQWIAANGAACLPLLFYRCHGWGIGWVAWRRKKLLLLLDNMRKEKKSIIPVECRGGGYFTSRLNSLGRVLFPCQIISNSFYFISESLNWIFMLLIFDWNIEWECFCELISTSLNKVNLSNFKAFSRFKFLSMLISSGYLCIHGTIYQHQWWMA